jgi:Ser-tRNA(Ala) deacylase AlaX
MDEAKKQYYPPMHTAEHILNRTMVNLFGCERSANCHIERKKSKCDFLLAEAPTDKQIQQIEKQINQIIEQNLQITQKIIPYEEAAEKFKLRINKQDNPQVRIIYIGDYDECPCIGQHVKSTSEIGQFKIISYTYYPENNILRIRFKVFPK